MKKYILAGVIALSATLPGTASDALQTYKSNVEAALADQAIPGAALALVGPEGAIGQMCFGIADLKTGAAVTEDTAFTLGSTSKMVIGMAIVQAVEKGTIQLDQKIAPLIDFEIGFKNADQITFADLAQHRSGIIDREDVYLSKATYHQGADHPTLLGDYLRAYLSESGEHYHAAANFSKHGEYQYSNIGSALAAYALQKASGKSFDKFTRSGIFEPLGMENTAWHLSDFQPNELARPHYDLDMEAFAPNEFYGLATWPDGGLHSSISDFSKFMAMMINAGELDDTRIVNKANFDLLFAGLNDDNERGYGLFLEKFRLKGSLPDRTTFWGHTGSDPGVVTFAVYNLDWKRGVVLMLNGEPEEEMVNNFLAASFDLFGLENAFRAAPDHCNSPLRVLID